MGSGNFDLSIQADGRAVVQPHDSPRAGFALPFTKNLGIKPTDQVFIKAAHHPREYCRKRTPGLPLVPRQVGDNGTSDRPGGDTCAWVMQWACQSDV
jgi:hypothetical protein